MAGLDDGFHRYFKENERFPSELQSLRSESLRNNQFKLNKWESLPVLPQQIEIRAQEVSGAKGVTSKYISLSLNLVSAFCENVLVHPFIVLKRQCQVNPNGYHRHLIPFTLIPIIIRIQSRQGIGTLWKGVGSMLIVKGLLLVFEDAVNKLTQWPKDTKSISTVKKLFEHLFLKFISAALVTPFYSACLVETVQSDIASEKPGLFDCIVEAAVRIIPNKTSSTSRVLPVWTLAFPTAAYSLVHYTTTTIVQRGIVFFWRRRKSSTQQTTVLDAETEFEFLDLTSFIAGRLVSDVLLFPFETILNRLHVQGTRTIIDNLDTGYEVTPIITRYEGAIDCFNTIIATDKIPGFFKGVGAVVLQYAIYFLVMRLTKLLFKELMPSRNPTLNSLARKN
ncbi:hypothetical protein CHUAL_000426 [Chamberlinius hualienensis]